jgi:hypothetical protein
MKLKISELINSLEARNMRVSEENKKVLEEV